MTDDGLITIRSAYSVSGTIDRLTTSVIERGMAIFARIDHARGATDAGLSLPPTELLVFGNAHTGTPLMQVRQTVGIDLPLKVLGWEDADGTVWLTYVDPVWIGSRHRLRAEVNDTLSRMRDLLAAIVAEVARATN